MELTELDIILDKITLARSADGRAKFHDSLKRRILRYIKDSNITVTKFSEMSKITASIIARWKREFSKTTVAKRKYTVASKTAPKKEAVETKVKESKSDPVVKLVYKDVAVFTILSNLKLVVAELTKA
jgi:transposase-like protein